jgi:hypothetical protein
MGGVALALAVAAPASAQVVQSLHVSFGVFGPRGFESRSDGDVLVANLTRPEIAPGLTDAYLFEISDFKGANILGEWQVGFGNHIELAAGVGYYANTVPSIYRDLVNDDGREIFQELRLRIVPISGVVRFLPFGNAGTVQPYAGAGISALNWSYSEIGEFVDPVTLEVFPARYKASGTDFGSLFLLGARFPIKGDIYGVTAEYRYQFGEGDLGGIESGFLGPKIDLSGWSLNFGFLVRF